MCDEDHAREVDARS